MIEIVRGPRGEKKMENEGMDPGRIDNVRSYGRIAEMWDRNRRERGIDPAVADWSKMLPHDAAILDIGCGSGYPIDVFLSGRGFTVTGIDPSKEMIGLANRLELDGASFQACGLFEFEPDAPFDAVIAFDSLFHIDLDSQPAIYPKVASWLKPGGLFLFTHGKKTGTVSGKMFGESFLYGALDADRLRGCLGEIGLEPIWFYEDYEAPVTGQRDLLVLARKTEENDSDRREHTDAHPVSLDAGNGTGRAARTIHGGESYRRFPDGGDPLP